MCIICRIFLLNTKHLLTYSKNIVSFFILDLVLSAHFTPALVLHLIKIAMHKHNDYHVFFSVFILFNSTRFSFFFCLLIIYNMKKQPFIHILGCWFYIITLTWENSLISCEKKIRGNCWIHSNMTLNKYGLMEQMQSF